MRLPRLARSLPLTALALVGICSACSLPQVAPRMSADFQSGAARVQTIAVLPVDLHVTLAGQPPGAPQAVQLDEKMLDRVHRGLGAALARRGYLVNAVLEPDGTAVDPRGGRRGLVIHPRDLAALRFEIHQLTAPCANGPGLIEARVSADLTRQLREVTGADASLYARGWAHVAREPSAGARAARIVLGVLLALVIVGVVLVVIAGKGRGAGGLTRVLAGTGRLMAHAAAAAGHVMMRTAPYVIMAAADAHAHAHVPCHRCPPPPPVWVEGPLEVTELDQPMPAPPLPSTPGPSAAPAEELQPAPVLHLRSGEPPTGHEVGLAMSLVENSTGRVLWHAGQRFAVRARGEGEVEDLIEHFLKGLPPAR